MPAAHRLPQFQQPDPTPDALDTLCAQFHPTVQQRLFIPQQFQLLEQQLPQRKLFQRQLIGK